MRLTNDRRRSLRLKLCVCCTSNRIRGIKPHIRTELDILNKSWRCPTSCFFTNSSYFCEQNIVEELTIAHLITKLLALFAIRTFFSVFTIATQWAVSWGRQTHFTSPTTYLFIMSFNIIRTSKHIVRNVSSFNYSDYIFVLMSLSLPGVSSIHTCYMPRPSHPWFHQHELRSYSVCLSLQPRLSFLLLRSKYSPHSQFYLCII